VLAAVNRWRFEPPLVDGRPALVRWRFRQTFVPD